MESNEEKILHLISQGKESLREAVGLLMEMCEDRIYSHCYTMLRQNSSLAQSLTEQVFREAPSVLINYEKGNLDVPLMMLATQLCQSQESSQIDVLWVTDQEVQTAGLSEIDLVILNLRRQERKWQEIATILGRTMRGVQRRGLRAEARLRRIRDEHV